MPRFNLVLCLAPLCLAPLCMACAGGATPHAQRAAVEHAPIVALERCGELPSARPAQVVEGFGGAGDAQLMITRVVPRVPCRGPGAGVPATARLGAQQ